MEQVDLDCELLKPLKIDLEVALKKLIFVALKTNKEAEISLKINISTTTFGTIEDDNKEEWTEPRIDYQINEKIKEYKDTSKGFVGLNYQLEIDEDNKLFVKKRNEQKTMFEEEEK